MKHKEKPEGWLINHMLSVFVWNFNYDARDFWWGKDDPWNRHEVISFRFLKIYIAEFWAFLLKCALLCPVVFVLSGGLSAGLRSLLITSYLFAGLLFFLSLALTLLAWVRVKNGEYDQI